MIDRFAFPAGPFGNGVQVVIAGLGQADVFEPGRQADRFAELVDLMDEFDSAGR